MDLDVNSYRSSSLALCAPSNSCTRVLSTTLGDEVQYSNTKAVLALGFWRSKSRSQPNRKQEHLNDNGGQNLLYLLCNCILWLQHPILYLFWVLFRLRLASFQPSTWRRQLQRRNGWMLSNGRMDPCQWVRARDSICRRLHFWGRKKCSFFRADFYRW